MLVALACLSGLLPTAQDPTLALGGERFAVGVDGAVGRRLLPAAADVRRAPVRWRVRARIATDLRLGDQRMTLSAAAVARIGGAFEGFGAAVSAWSRGRVRIDLDLAPLDRPLRVAAPAGRDWFLTPTAERDLGVAGRGTDSVFLVFPPGQRDLPMLGGSLGADLGPDGVGSSGIAWVEQRAAEMVTTLVHEWLHQVVWLARHRHGMPWLPGPHDGPDLGFADEPGILAALLADYLPAAFWSAAVARRTTPVQRLPAAGGHRYPAVAADPWRRLPLLDAAQLSRLVGEPVALEVRGDQVAVRRGGRLPPPGGGLDARLELARESVARLPVAGDPERCLLLVRGDRLALFADHLRGDPVLAGVLLPLRDRRRIDAWEAGGTATPLAVFVLTAGARAHSEVELLALRAGDTATWLRRTTAPVVVGAPMVLEPVGPARGVHVAIDGRRQPLSGPVRLLPSRVGPLTVALHRGDQVLPYRWSVRPRLAVGLHPRSGPDVVVRSPAPFVCRLANHTPAAIECRLLARLPAGIDRLELPATVRLAAGQVRELPCRLWATAAPPGAVELAVEARFGDRVLGATRRPLYLALGGDFLRLGFEAAPPTGAPPTGAPLPAPATDPGDWRAEPRRGDAAVGAGFLRLHDGGGSRFGRHYLLAPSAASYDTETFPYLVFHARARPLAVARAALNIRVGTRVVAVPLVGAFVRAWDHRIGLPPAVFQADGRWQRVVYDLDAALDAALGDGSHRVAAIDLGDTRARCSNRFRGADSWWIDVDDFAVVRAVATQKINTDRRAADSDRKLP